MWGFQRSKAEEKRDPIFIAQRRLELAQLNRTTQKLAMTFEEKLQGLLRMSIYLRRSTNERAFLVRWKCFEITSQQV